MKASLEKIARQSLHHRIFHYTPHLRFKLQDKIQTVFELFLNWAHQENLAMDWTLHVCFLNWLCKQKDWLKVIDAEVIKELLIAAGTRWSLNGLDHLQAKGILLTSHHLPGLAIGLWKSQKVDETNQIIQVRLAKTLGDGYAISYIEGRWDKWMSLSC